MASENEKRETVADIIVEMRHGLDQSWHDIDREWVRELPDRIEAAWKRDEERAVEHATRHAEAVARDNCRDCIHNPKGANYESVTGSHAIGNAAAMREALETLLNLAWVVQDENSEGGPRTRVPEQFIIEVAKSALSAPARNCDKMPDIDNLTMHDLAKSPCKSTLEYASREELLALVRWLLAPAAERKGEGDGR